MRRNKIISLALAIVLVLLSFPISSPVLGAGAETSREKAVKAVKERVDNSQSTVKKPVFGNSETLRVIVELEDEPAILAGEAAAEKIAASEASVKQKMRELGIPFNELFSMDTLVSAFSIEVKRQYLTEISKIPGVKRVHEAQRYLPPDVKPTKGGNPPDHKGATPELYASVDIIGAQKVWNETGYRGEGTLVGILDTGFDINHNAFSLDEGVEVKYTEAEMNALIREKGLPGKYVSSKVPYVFNYQDMTADSLLDSYGSRHGLHVAGIIGANAKEGKGEIPPIRGVAPHAQLAILKVFSQDVTMVSTPTDAQVRAIEDAIKLGCDSINMSLGSRAGFVEGDDSLINVAFRNARAAGVFVAVSQGNNATPYEGRREYGLLYAKKENPDLSNSSSPALSSWASAVASTENTSMVTNVAKASFSGGVRNIGYLLGSSTTPFSLEIKAGELVECGNGSPESFEGKDLKGKVALIKRGGATFSNMGLTAHKMGAKGAILYNNQPGTILMGSDAVPKEFPFCSITAENGKFLLEHINDVKVVFEANKEGIDKNANSMKMSGFSSWGPAPDLRIKPEISAPGGVIYSADEGNLYQTMSGTSMASPHIAGVAAIISQFVNDEKSVFHTPALKSGASKEEFVRLIMMNTAVPQKEPQATYYNVRRQGAGLVSLSNAVKNEVLIRATGGADTTKDEKVEFKSTSEKKLTANLEITNYSNEVKSFRGNLIVLKDKLADSELYTDSKIITEKSEDMNFESGFVNQTVVIPAGETVTVQVPIDFSKDEIGENAFVEGFIRLIATSSEDSDLTVPFLAFYGNWNTPRIFDKFPHELAKDETPQNIDYNVWEGEAQVRNPENKSLKVFEKDKKKYYVWNPDLCKAKNGKITLKIDFVVMRNAEDVKIEELDSEGNFKSMFYSSDGERKAYPGASMRNATFARNSLAYAKDGEVSRLRLSAKLNDPSISERQTVELPLLSDQQNPIIENFKLIEENGKKLVEFKLSDSTLVDRFGLQAVNSDGSLGKEVEVSQSDGKYSLTDWEYDDNKERHSKYFDLIGEESNKSIEAYKNGSTVKVDITKFAKSKEVMLYVSDLAGNFSSKFLEVNGEESSYAITNSKDSNADLEVVVNTKKGKEDKKDNDKFIIKPGERKDVVVGSGGSISALGKGGSLFKLETFMVGGKDFRKKASAISPKKGEPQKFSVNISDFSELEKGEVLVKLEELKVEPQKPHEYPKVEDRKYPIVAMDKPYHYWYISENDPETNPQKDPEIVNGMLQFRGNVLYTTPEELDRVELVFQNPITREPASPVYTVEKSAIKEKHFKKRAHAGVIYDAMSLFFEGEMPMPKDGRNYYTLTVSAVNKDGRRGEIGLSIHIDKKAPDFNVKMAPRELNSRSVSFNYTLADDSMINEISVQILGSGEQIFYKQLSLEDKVFENGHTVYKGSFSYDNLPKGVTFLQFVVSEAGTSRKINRTIGVYRMP